MRMLIAYLVAAMLYLPVAQAADPLCTPQSYSNPEKPPDFSCPSPGEDTLVPKLKLRTSTALRLGAKAPFDGVLMGKNRVIQLGLRVKALRRLRYNDALQAEDLFEAERELVRAQAKADINLRTSQRDNYKEQVKVLRGELDKANAWYRSWTFGLVLGILVTAAGATAMGFALRE